MNLLPKNRQEFSEKSYWDTFFDKRGNKAFEWYGEYPELCEHLHKYLKPKDEILIVGCGNSNLGNDLYDVGHRKITSIDISQVAIRQMNNLNEKRRPEMKFIQMDALNSDFKDSEFTAILDKGTLDALMPDSNQEAISKINKYFNEIIRILASGGRYICISLLQEHILEILLEYFPKNNCMLRVVRCYEAEKNAQNAGESSMPVFIVICTKFKALPMKVLELNLGEKMLRIEGEKDLIKRVKEAQQAAFICSGLKKTTIEGGEVSFEVFRASEDVPRYTIFVVDGQKERRFKLYAAFIVPQGRESEWLFSSKEGRKELANMSQCNRLAVVTLHREQSYENLDVIKDELGDSVRNFAPSNIGDEKIQFLSLGADAGDRTVRFKGNSKFSGDYVIEDVSIDGNKFRRLYYMSSQLVIQSEAKLKEGKSRSGRSKETIDYTYLTCGHHFYMSRAVHMAASKKEKPLISIIGLGGGGLCSFLRKFLPKLKIIGVDVDEDMLKIAKEWFGLNTDENMKVEIKDGLEFLKENAKSSVNKFDVVLFDVDSKDVTIGMSCPPKEFLSEQALSDTKACLKSTGFFIMNVVLRDNSLRPGILKELSGKFATIASYKLEQDLNEVFICTAESVPEKQLRVQFDEAMKDLNKFLVKSGNKSLVEECDNGKGLVFFKKHDK